MLCDRYRLNPRWVRGIMTRVINRVVHLVVFSAMRVHRLNVIGFPAGEHMTADDVQTLRILLLGVVSSRLFSV